MIYQNISREEYVELEGINASSLKGYFESSLNGNYEKNKPWTTSKAMHFGTACHSLILEPAEFIKLYDKMPAAPVKEDGTPLSKLTKIYKEWKANLPTDKIYLDDAEWDLLISIQGNLEENANAQKILKACPHRESAITWTDERTGLKCKALMDFIGDKIGGDFKTTRDIPVRDDIEATANALQWDMIKNRNVLQFSFYFDGCLANDINIEKFAVIYAKNNGNCDTATALLSDDTLQIGRNMYEVALDNWIKRSDNESAFVELMEI